MIISDKANCDWSRHDSARNRGAPGAVIAIRLLIDYTEIEGVSFACVGCHFSFKRFGGEHTGEVAGHLAFVVLLLKGDFAGLLVEVFHCEDEGLGGTVLIIVI